MRTLFSLRERPVRDITVVATICLVAILVATTVSELRRRRIDARLEQLGVTLVQEDATLAPLVAIFPGSSGAILWTRGIEWRGKFNSKAVMTEIGSLRRIQSINLNFTGVHDSDFKLISALGGVRKLELVATTI